MNGKRLEEKAAERGIAQEEMEQRLGMMLGTYSGILAGIGGDFTVAQAKQLAGMLDLAPEEAGEIFFA